MAKYITYLAILANVILGLWVYSQPKEPSLEEKIKTIPVDKRLILMSELFPTELESVDDTPIPEIEVTQANKQTSSETESNDTASQQAETVEAEEQQVCYTVGPFLKGSDANQVGKNMQGRNLLVTRREKIEQVVDGYRVYIKPLPTRQEAVAVTRELTDLGILDYFIINNPEHKNGISLGLFKQKSGAIRRLAQIRRFNFNVTMEARQSETQVYWLDVIDKEESFTEEYWREISETQRQLQRLTKKC